MMRARRVWDTSATPLRPATRRAGAVGMACARCWLSHTYPKVVGRSQPGSAPPPEIVVGVSRQAPPQSEWPPAAVEVCCGEGGSWAQAGKEFVAGCGLCPRSRTWWQKRAVLR